MSQATDTEKIISSPCVDICALGDDDVCIGCYRHGREVSQWNLYTNEQKAQVLNFCKQRAQGKNIQALT